MELAGLKQFTTTQRYIDVSDGKFCQELFCGNFLSVSPGARWLLATKMSVYVHPLM